MYKVLVRQKVPSTPDTIPALNVRSLTVPLNVKNSKDGEPMVRLAAIVPSVVPEKLEREDPIKRIVSALAFVLGQGLVVLYERLK
jgi:hypothetical protein